MSNARRFLFLEISFLGGVALATFWLPSTHWVVTLLALAVILYLAAPRRLKILFFFMPILFWFGMLRLQTSERSDTPSDLHTFSGSAITVRGVIDAEVDRRLTSQRFVFSVRSLEKNDEHLNIHGRVLVRTGLYPVYQYGDPLRINCRLEQPEPIEGFAYDEYLALSGVYSVCSFARVTYLDEQPKKNVLGMILAFKRWFLGRLAQLFPEPQGSFLGGLLVGARKGMSPDLLDAFQVVGLTHIIALSGYNITILATAVFAVTLSVGMSRQHAFLVVTGFLLLFVLLTGAPSTVVRASIMGFLVLLARRTGRAGNVWYALVFAATVMVIINPRVLVFDVGFQLSFLATLGLLLVTPRLERWFLWLPGALGIREAAVATLGATSLTLPLIVFQFGRLSLVSPLVNILVLPIIPLTMLLGFLAVLIPFLGHWIAYCAWLLLTWVIVISESFSQLHFASVPVPSLPLWGLLMLYALPLSVAVIRRVRAHRKAVS